MSISFNIGACSSKTPEHNDIGGLRPRFGFESVGDEAGMTGKRTIGQIRALVMGSKRGENLFNVPSVRLQAGKGILGDRHFSQTPYGKASRDLTLIEWETIERLRSNRGMEFGLLDSRRNVVTEGVKLENLIGRRFFLGDVTCIGIKACPPCPRLGQLTSPDVVEALKDCGGLCAAIVTDGVVWVGDSVCGF